jgi:hypothetical protein
LDAPFSSSPVDRFDEWLRAAAPLESTHRLFEIRRAMPAEFDRIYDLVDDTFGFKRSRARHDWLYRRNPYGTARCWVTFDRATGQLIGSWASWPWPVARGTQLVDGCQDGDWVVAQGWQRYGTGDLCAQVLLSHAWQGKAFRFAWPNEKSRGVAVKHGHGAEIMGPVPKAVLVLNARDYLKDFDWLAPVGAVGGAVVDLSMRAWRKVVLQEEYNSDIEPIRRFESIVDEVTQRCMTWPGFWSPHSAEFLNWRYIEHPTSEHLAFALMAGDNVAGFYVLKIERKASWLMEFVVPVASRFASALLRHLIATARAAGCNRIQFSAPPRWRHWKLLRRAGFLPVPSGIYMWPWPNSEEPEIAELAAWQWVPGDMDFR